MSMTSLIRTLNATSAEGCRLWVLNLDGAIDWLAFEVASEQTSAMTSEISAGFNLKGCCSLVKEGNIMSKTNMQIKRQEWLWHIIKIHEVLTEVYRGEGIWFKVPLITIFPLYIKDMGGKGS